MAPTSIRSGRISIAFLAALAALLTACAATAPEAPRPVAERPADRPAPVYYVNLSLHPGWRPLDREEDDYYAVLEAECRAAIGYGYRRITLARPLSREHRFFAPSGPRREVSNWEPLQQWSTLEPAQRRALTRAQAAFPQLEFGTHLGYEHVAWNDSPPVRTHAAWDQGWYVEAVEREVEAWNDRGFFVWLEGIAGPDPRGLRQGRAMHERGLKIGTTIWPMRPDGVVGVPSPVPAMGTVGFLLNKRKAGQLELDAGVSGGPRYLAIDLGSREQVLPRPSPFVRETLGRPGVGVMVLNNGRRTDNLYRLGVRLSSEPMGDR